MDTTTLLLIVIVFVLGGGYYGEGTGLRNDDFIGKVF